MVVYGQTITLRLCWSFLLTVFPAPAWLLPTGSRSFPNCSSMGSSCGLQSFGRNLLQRGSSMGCGEGNPCLGVLSTSFPPPALPLGSAGLFLTHFPLTPSLLGSVSPFLSRASPEAALQWGGLGPTGTSHVQPGAGRHGS